MTMLFVYFGLAIGVSFLCSVMEAVLLSVTHAHIQIIGDKHVKVAKILDAFKRDVETPLSAILSLNTIAHTLGAAEVGAQAQLIFGKASVGIISGVLTFLILVLSEIIPKTIGATYWRSLMVPSAYIIRFMVYSMYPLTVLSRVVTRLISRGKTTSVFSREEFSAQVELGIQEGGLNTQESNIIKNTIAFRRLCARDIMTPRIVLITCSGNDTAREVISGRTDLPVSRILIHEDGNPEHITGYALKNDLLDAISRDSGEKTAGEFRREVMQVPDSMHVDELLRKFLETNDHIAVLIDEYGGLAGIATLEDVLETLLGAEIVDEIDTEKDLQSFARQQWRRRAEKLGLV